MVWYDLQIDVYVCFKWLVECSFVYKIICCFSVWFMFMCMGMCMKTELAIQDWNANVWNPTENQIQQQTTNFCKIGMCCNNVHRNSWHQNMLLNAEEQISKHAWNLLLYCWQKHMASIFRLLILKMAGTDTLSMLLSILAKEGVFYHAFVLLSTYFVCIHLLLPLFMNYIFRILIR